MSMEREVAEYTAKTGRSRALFEEALRVMPGGNSRTTTFFDPYPFYLQRGQGAHVWDEDGNERMDFNGNYTSLILGHATPDGGAGRAATAAAAAVLPGAHGARDPAGRSLVPAHAIDRERVRFTNSGTEATMNAVRLARAFTGRPKLAKFEGAFHGTHDWVMVSVTPDPKTAGQPQAARSR